jgi:hypothetical protein
MLLRVRKNPDKLGGKNFTNACRGKEQNNAGFKNITFQFNY